MIDLSCFRQNMTNSNVWQTNQRMRGYRATFTNNFSFHMFKTDIHCLYNKERNRGTIYGQLWTIRYCLIQQEKINESFLRFQLAKENVIKQTLQN